MSPLSTHSRPSDQAAPTELARGSVGTTEVFAQAIAASAPSVALAAVPGELYLIANKGALVSAIFAAVVVLLVAYLVSLQARRTVSPGSLGTYTGNGFGPLGAFTAGWGLVIGYLAFAGAALFGAVIYLTAFLAKLDADTSSKAWTVVLLLLVAIPIIAAPYRGLRVSARAGLVFEVVSLTAIAVVLVASYVSYGFHIDTSQFTADGVGVSGLLLGAVLGVGAYAGFESAASLGFEARDPHRTIPRVLLTTVLGLVALYVVATYGEVLSFSGTHGTVTGNSAPLDVVAANAGVDWTGYVVNLAIAIAMLAFGSAVLNAGARSLYAFAKEGGLPAVFTRTHPRFRSPHIGILTLGVVGLVASIGFTLYGTGPLRASAYIGTVGAFGYFVTYLLVAIATPVYLWRLRALAPHVALAAAVAAAGMVYVLYKTVYPAPPYPYNILPYVFLGLLALGLVRYAYLRATDPERARQIGTHQEPALAVESRLEPGAADRGISITA
jgi:amino acid transporter